MIKIKFVLSTILTVAIAFLVQGNFYGGMSIADAAPPVGWVDDGTIVRLETATDLVGVGTTSPAEKLGVTGNIFVTGDILLTGLIDGFSISSSAPSWDQAFNQRNRWDGNSDGLNAATGRTSLGLGSLATASAVSGGSGGTITDNSIANNDLATSTFWNITGIGALDGVILNDTDGSDCHKVTVNSAGTLSTVAVNCDTGDPILGPSDNFNSYSSGNLNGNSGGSGWSAAWVDTASTIWKIDTTSHLEGVNSAVATGTVSASAYRDFNAIVSGQLSVRLELKGLSGVVGLQDGATAKGRIAPGETGANSLDIWNGSSYTNFDTYTDSVPFTLEIDFGGQGGVCSSTQYRARKNSNTWSSCVSMLNSGGNVTRAVFEYQDSVNREYWVDEIVITD